MIVEMEEKANTNRKDTTMNTKNRTYCQGCRFWDADEDECGYDLPLHVTEMDQMPATAADRVCGFVPEPDFDNEPVTWWPYYIAYDGELGTEGFATREEAQARVDYLNADCPRQVPDLFGGTITIEAKYAVAEGPKE